MQGRKEKQLSLIETFAADHHVRTTNRAAHYLHVAVCFHLATLRLCVEK